jgi:hypothetical protein
MRLNRSDTRCAIDSRESLYGYIWSKFHNKLEEVLTIKEALERERVWNIGQIEFSPVAGRKEPRSVS